MPSKREHLLPIGGVEDSHDRVLPTHGDSAAVRRQRDSNALVGTRHLPPENRARPFARGVDQSDLTTEHPDDNPIRAVDCGDVGDRSLDLPLAFDERLVAPEAVEGQHAAATGEELAPALPASPAAENPVSFPFQFREPPPSDRESQLIDDH